jgi:arylsulfatase A-like enzyme
LNVVFLVIDTLRADHLGCYGYGRNTSPNINALAAQSVVFENHISPAIPTHPAFVTMNTGQFSITHGVVAHGGHNELRRTSPWMPASFQRRNYNTCAVDNLADWSAGFRRGFEFYIDPTQRHVLGLKCTNRDINKRAIPWLRQQGKEPFYLFVHYWDPHTPYMPPRAYRKLFYQGDPCDPANTAMAHMTEHPLGRMWRDTWFNKLGECITDPEYIVSLYDSEIRFVDEGVGQLLKALDETGHADDTLVVVTGDHGELMYRHGVFFDHHGLYDGNLHVPLIVRHPGIGSRRVSQMSAHVDIAPTLLDLCGVEVPEEMEGVPLGPWMRGETAEPVREFVVSEECTWQMKWAIRTERHKFILAREEDFYGTPMRELYDLQADPDELRNIVEDEPAIAADLELRLEDWIAQKMAQNGLTEDPLRAHGITLGRAWKEERGL